MPGTDFDPAIADQTPDSSVDETADDVEVVKDEGVDDEEVIDTPDEDVTDEENLEDDSDDSEEPVEFKTWAKQYDLPDEIQSEDDLAKYYQTHSKEKPQGLSPDMQQVDAILKSRGIDGGVQALLAGTDVPSQAPAPTGDAQQTQSFFPDKPFSTRIKTMVENGSLEGDHVKGWKQYAEFSDAALAPTMKLMREALGAIAQQVESNKAEVGNLSWESKAGQLKGTGVDRAKIEEIKIRHNFSTDQALKFYAMQEDPKFFEKLQVNAEEKGKNKAIKKLKRSTGIPKNRGGKATVAGFDHQKFTHKDGSLNEAAIEGLFDPDESLKMIAKYEKWSKQKSR